MNPWPTPIGLDAITETTVRFAILALNGKDRRRWFDLFSARPRFSDDGMTRDFARWCDDELFGSVRAYIFSIDNVEEGGLTFYASYHSDKWGDFKTFWKFTLTDGKISTLDVGATDY